MTQHCAFNLQSQRAMHDHFKYNLSDTFTSANAYLTRNRHSLEDAAVIVAKYSVLPLKSNRATLLREQRLLWRRQVRPCTQQPHMIGNQRCKDCPRGPQKAP
eukprot:1137820-Pelagomonas_calceolata.AAC.2